MLHEESLDPVVMLLMQDPISDRRGLLRDGEALAEALGQDLQQGPRQAFLVLRSRRRLMGLDG